ncbi:DUF4879 domain-containing protein [Archangium lansingense]
MSELHVNREARAAAAGRVAEGAEGRVHQLGPAPNLSSIHVIAVCSADFYATYAPYDCEDVSTSGSTVFNHGGAWMEVITQEMGYRAYGSATMAGNSVSEIHNQGILNVYNEYIGWYRWFDVSAYSSGYFYYSAASINTYAVYSDSVTVL